MLDAVIADIKEFVETWAALATLLTLVFAIRLSPETRGKWAAFILRLPNEGKSDADSIASISEFAGSFIENTVFRWFGLRPLSWYALAKSFLLSIMVYVSLGVIIYLLFSVNILRAIYDPIEILWESDKTCVVLAIVIVLLADFASNFVTYNLMWFAMKSGSFAQVVFLAMMDVFASVYVFVLIFPVALMILYYGFYTTSYRVAGLYGIIDVTGATADEVSRYMIADSTQTLGSADYGPWMKFTDTRYDKIGALAVELLLSAEVDAGATLGTQVDGRNQIYPRGEGIGITVTGVLRYHGLPLKDIGGFLASHHALEPDHDETKWITSNIPWFYIAGSHEYTAYLGERWHAADLKIYRWDALTRMRVLWERPRRLWQWLEWSYSAGFEAVQGVQERFFPILTMQPLALPLFGEKYTENNGIEEANDVVGARATKKEKVKLQNLYWDYCDDEIYITSKPEERNCRKRVVVSGRYYAASIIPIAGLTIVQEMPFGYFFLTSASVTMVFYATLFLFLGAVYAIRLLIPAHIRKDEQSAIRDMVVVESVFLVVALIVTIALSL